jgi:hypothetical protein
MHGCNMHWFFLIIIIITIWDIVWKLISLWKSARNNQLAWFICLAVFNTMGILPIIYLLTHRRKGQNP